MISHAGIAIFLFGNKLDGDQVVDSNGMREEYEISKAQGVFTIPVGATGYMSRQLWCDEMESCKDTPSKFSELIAGLNSEASTLEALEEQILEAVKVKINQGDV